MLDLETQMELFDAIIMALGVGGAPMILFAIMKVLVRLMVRVYVISDSDHISALDRHLSRNGWCSARTFGPGRLPADGCHVLFVWDWPMGLIFAMRRTVDEGNRYCSALRTYTLYEVGRAMRVVGRHIADDPHAVVMRYVYVPSPWRISSTVHMEPVSVKPRPWQHKAIMSLKKAYDAKGRATMLVCGKSGTGKSSLGELFAKHLMTEGVVPEVVKNLDLAARGLILEDAYGRPTINSPIIIMLDELDSCIEFAERDKKDAKSEASSLADSPTSLLSVFDRLNRTDRTIVIATTNHALKDMNKPGGIYARYIRPGRFDLHLQV